ncbi:MAG: hypothetical protein KKE62_01855 [Proteobacteria bacterium]|nr:hypothetical protein [Pseudomonadota bacterium]MBU1387117.1 hypothetical protein [Pseudomonadota bacterium]MBU1541566.1 hypothetical protein [Pseudomonadota bacterium]MBU2429091.1 hypothetical protein [Pseudomonadota bacterium]MBU2482764.1 hypothetical protein [Pseudomonadota bacterium]
MNRFVTGIFAPQQRKIKRHSYLIRMYCPDCHQFKQVTNSGLPCKDCGSNNITLASNWKPDLHVIPGGKNVS